MQEDLVSKETAKLAKEVGFDKPCWDFIDYRGEDSSVMRYIGDTFEEKHDVAKKWVSYYVPTQASLQKWLREVHNIEVFVRPFINCDTHEKHYRCFIVWFDGRMYHDGKYFSDGSAEGALEQGLQEGLKLIRKE